jgi:hypothetical protein
MPVQGSWVELWLDRYCAPGKHRFHPARPGVVRCSRCTKEELAGGATCMVCGIPGERDVFLISAAELASYRGKLCGTCADEFDRRRLIRGWAARAS